MVVYSLSKKAIRLKASSLQYQEFLEGHLISEEGIDLVDMA